MKFAKPIPIKLRDTIKNILVTPSKNISIYLEKIKSNKIKKLNKNYALLPLSEIQKISLKNEDIYIVVTFLNSKNTPTSELYCLDLTRSIVLDIQLVKPQFVYYNGQLAWYGTLPQNAIIAPVNKPTKGTFYALNTKKWYWLSPEYQVQYELKNIQKSLSKNFIEKNFPKDLQTLYTWFGMNAINWLQTQYGYRYIFWSQKTELKPRVQLKTKYRDYTDETLQISVSSRYWDYLEFYPGCTTKYHLAVIPDQLTYCHICSKEILKELDTIPGLYILETIATLYQIRNQISNDTLELALDLWKLLPWHRFDNNYEQLIYTETLENLWSDSAQFNLHENGYLFHPFFAKLGIYEEAYLVNTEFNTKIDDNNYLLSTQVAISSLLHNYTYTLETIINTINILWLYYHDNTNKFKYLPKSLAVFLVDGIRITLPDETTLDELTPVLFDYHWNKPPFSENYHLENLLQWDEPIIELNFNEEIDQEDLDYGDIYDDYYDFDMQNYEDNEYDNIEDDENSQYI